VSEKRLQEIKDSVNFQKEMLLAHNLGTLCVDEEQELIDEIERLNNIINKAIEYIEKNVWSCYILDDEKELIETDSEELLEILKGSDKE